MTNGKMHRRIVVIFYLQFLFFDTPRRCNISHPHNKVSLFLRTFIPSYFFYPNLIFEPFPVLHHIRRMCDYLSLVQFPPLKQGTFHQARSFYTASSPHTLSAVIQLQPISSDLITISAPANPASLISESSSPSEYTPTIILKSAGIKGPPFSSFNKNSCTTNNTRPAAQGHADVARITNQIGVTCKLIRTTDTNVHLITIKERYETTVMPKKDLLRALVVLCHISIC